MWYMFYKQACITKILQNFWLASVLVSVFFLSLFLGMLSTVNFGQYFLSSKKKKKEWKQLKIRMKENTFQY